MPSAGAGLSGCVPIQPGSQSASQPASHPATQASAPAPSLPCSWTSDKEGVLEVMRTLPAQLGLQVGAPSTSPWLWLSALLLLGV